MLARWIHASLPEQTVEISIEKNCIRIHQSGNDVRISNRDLLEVSYPGKNKALLLLNDGQLYIEAPNIRGTLRHFMGDFNERISYGERVMSRGLWLFLILCSSLVALALLFWFLLLPWLADQAAIHFPRAQEIALGKELKSHYLSTERIDSSKTLLLNQFAAQLDLGKEFPADYTVVDADIVNAYALPGGPVVVYTGILRKMTRWEELAGLLAHERSHVLHHHSTRSLFRNASGAIMLNLVLGDASSTVNIFAQQGQQIQQLAYSRDLELEADREGLQLLLNNDVNPEGMLSLLEQLKKESGNSILPEFLSTHPMPEARMKALEKNIKEHPIETEHPALDSLWKQLSNRSSSPAW